MFDFHTHLTESCPDLISRIENIRTLGLHFSKEFNEVNVGELQSRAAKALVQNQHIESLQLTSSYDILSRRLAEEIIVAKRPILSDLQFVTGALGV